MFDLGNEKIPIFTDINDVPVAPSATTAGNASHLISKYNSLIDQLEAVLDDLCPTSHTHWHTDSIVVNGSGLSNGQNTNQRFNAFTSFATSALNDAFKFNAILQAGTYDLRILGYSSSAGGTIDCRVDGDLAFNDVDFYGGSWNASWTRTVTIPDSGTHEFLFTVIGKNAASTDYFVPITRFNLKKTS